MRLKSFSYLIATGLFSAFLIAKASLAQTPVFTGEINSQNINIRADSTTEAEIICQINKGTKVEVISELYEWYKIRLPKAAPAFIKKEFLKCVNYENINSPGILPLKTGKDCISAVAIKDRINIRLKSDESSPVIGRLNENEVVNIVRPAGNWYMIEPIPNSFGWVNKKFVNKVQVEIKTDKKRR